MPTWGKENIELLTDLWGDLRISTTEIAVRLGFKDKNAIIGKAHRLKLPPRESYKLVQRPPMPEPEVPHAEVKVERPCKWHLWPAAPLTDQERYCGKESLPDDEYCAQHAARAYVRRKD